MMAIEATDEERAYCTTLTNRGYRRVSNKYGLVARIDRPDWVQALAQHMRKPVADFYLVDRPNIIGIQWADHYRRVYSKDTVTLDPVQLARLVPASDGDRIGYVDKDGQEKNQCGVVCLLHGCFKHAVRCPVCIAPDMLVSTLLPVIGEIRELANGDDRWREVARAYDLLTREPDKPEQEVANTEDVE